MLLYITNIYASALFTQQLMYSHYNINSNNNIIIIIIITAVAAARGRDANSQNAENKL
jgi:hypothetical protein